MKEQIMHILGNLKGGVINAEQAFESINSVYLIEVQKLRYPSEPPLYRFATTRLLRKSTKPSFSLTRNFKVQNKV